MNYKIFYYLTAFCFGGALTHLTLWYIPQAITMAVVGLLSIGVGLFFKKYHK